LTPSKILGQFNRDLGCRINPEIVTARDNHLEIRNRLAIEMGLEPSDECEESAETLWNQDRLVVLVFLDRCPDLRYALYHEFSHCLNYEVNRELLLRSGSWLKEEEGTRKWLVGYGLKFWNEFIANRITTEVLGELGLDYFKFRERVFADRLDEYWTATFMGLFDFHSLEGMENEEASYFKKVMEILAMSDELVISEELAEKLGATLNNWATYRFFKIAGIGSDLDEAGRAILYDELRKLRKRKEV